MLVLTIFWIIGSLEVGKTEHMQRLCQIQKIFIVNLLRMSKRLESISGKTDHKVVRNESIHLESGYARLGEANSFAEDAPSTPNLGTHTSVVKNSWSSVNISEGLDEDDTGALKMLNEFLSTSDEALVSPNEHRNRLDTFMNQKRML